MRDFEKPNAQKKNEKKKKKKLTLKTKANVFTSWMLSLELRESQLLEAMQYHLLSTIC